MIATHIDRTWRRYSAAMVKAASLRLGRKRRKRALIWARIYVGALFKIGELR